MKAKKLELKEEGVYMDGDKAFDLYIDGKKIRHQVCRLNPITNIRESEVSFTQKQGDTILSCSFSDFPDNIKVADFYKNKLRTKITYFESIIRKGKKLRTQYVIEIEFEDLDFLWKPEIYIKEMYKILIKKGFAFEKGIDSIWKGEETIYGDFYFNHEKTKGKLSELVNECMELIKEAEKETNVHLVSTALKKMGLYKVTFETNKSE